jgi:hypothetical protein
MFQLPKVVVQVRIWFSVYGWAYRDAQETQINAKDESLIIILPFVMARIGAGPGNYAASAMPVLSLEKIS